MTLYLTFIWHESAKILSYKQDVDMNLIQSCCKNETTSGLSICLSIPDRQRNVIKFIIYFPDRRFEFENYMFLSAP